jgi:hypothetical protein
MPVLTPDDPRPSSAPAPVVRWLAGNRSTSVPATRVRCRLPARLLRQAGFDSRLTRRREDPTDGPLDVLVVQDPRSEDDVAVARAASQLGATVIVDLSDQALADTDVARGAVTAATAVTVRQLGIARLVDHPLVRQTDDAVEWAYPSPPIPPRPQQGEPARLTWFGVARGPSEGTGLDELATLAAPLAALARRRRIDLVLVTDDCRRADALLHERRLPGRSVDWSPWRLRSVLATSHVCLLPTGPEDAARVRSANRAVTALVQGVPVVAGAVPAYEALGPGVAFGSWETNIDRLLADQDLVERQVGRGREAVRRRFADARIIGQWRSLLGPVQDCVGEAAPVGQATSRAGG